jgi:hypothetical protein
MSTKRLMMGGKAVEVDDYIAYIERTIKSYSDDELDSVETDGFYSCEKLESIYLPACTTIGEQSFQYCWNLKTISLPMCSSIGDNAFTYCSLVSVSLPMCINVGRSAFSSCASLTSVSLPIATSIGHFYNDKSLGYLYVPKCTQIKNYAFQGCSKLTSIDLPECVNVETNAFYGSGFTEIHFATANQTTIEALAGYSSKFGATNATIYFDL